MPQLIPVNINESIITVLENGVEIFIGSEESAKLQDFDSVLFLIYALPI